MVNVVWECDPEWHDELSRAAFEAALDGVRHHLADVRCAAHGESPTVIVRGRTEDALDLDVQGYCERLVAPARAKLAELRGGPVVDTD
jgi:hypothetical protein